MNIEELIDEMVGTDIKHLVDEVWIEGNELKIKLVREKGIITGELTQEQICKLKKIQKQGVKNGIR